MHKDIKPEYDCGRIILKPVSMDNAPDIFKYFNKKVTKYMYPKAPEKIEDTIKYLKKAIRKNEQGKNYEVAIYYKWTDSLEFIGGGGLHDINTKTPEFGVWIREEYQGCALGYDAIGALRDWADKHLDYEYIKYPVDRRNKPSIGIPEYLKGKIMDEYPMKSESGKMLDVIEYRIFK
jgi:RimJ/RimL family protein N-acetyltransferase